MNDKDKDKYYYFPTMTKNIALVRNEKYIFIGTVEFSKLKKGEEYTLSDFKNNSWKTPLEFRDKNNQEYRICCFDIGNFISVKEHRKYKLKKINEHTS